MKARGYLFSKEGILEEKKSGFKGRYDFMVEKDGIYYAIETKIDDDSHAPLQLKEYIDSIFEKEEIPRNKIKGIIICGRASEKTKKKAKNRRFRIYEYKLDIKFQNLYIK